MRPWYVAAAVLAAWAIMYVQHPLGGDQGILLWVGDVIRSGGLPYRDTFEIRGPAFDYVHALIVAVFGRNEWGIRVFDLVMLALGGWLVWRIAFALFGQTAATAGTVLFLLWYAAVDYWSTAQSDGWTAIVLAGVVALLVPSEKRLTALRVALAGGLVALCTMNKPTFAMYLALPALAVLIVPASDRRLRRVLAMWAATGAGFAVPILLCLAWFALHGALDDLIEVHILFTVSQYSGLEQPWLTRFQAATIWLLTSKFAVALGIAVGGLAFLARARRADAILLGAWVGLGLFNVIAQARFWEYHWLVVYPPVSVLAGIGVHALLQMRAALSVGPGASPPSQAMRSIPSAILAVLFVAALFSPSLEIYRWAKMRLGLTNAEEHDRVQYGPYGRGPTSFVAIARHIASRTTERDEVLVWGTVQGINFLSERRSPTRFTYLDALTKQRDSTFRPKYLREFLDVMQTKPPTYIVAADERVCDVFVQSGPASNDHIAFPMSCLSELPDLQRIVAERYSLERTFGAWLLYRLRV